MDTPDISSQILLNNLPQIHVEIRPEISLGNLHKQHKEFVYEVVIRNSSLRSSTISPQTFLEGHPGIPLEVLLDIQKFLHGSFHKFSIDIG